MSGFPLHRYWFRWQPDEQAGIDPRVGGELGCGVTAVDVEDARSLIRSIALRGQDLPPVAEIIEDAEVGTLDADQVAASMANPDKRGVWFPRHPDPADFEVVHVDRVERFALELDGYSGRGFVSFPVSNQMAEYLEYYEVDRDTFDRFAADPTLAHGFVKQAKHRELDHLLLRPPGTDRGWA